MTTGPGTGRVSTSETIRGLLAAAAAQRPVTPPRSTVELTRNAKGDVQWTITSVGEDIYLAEQDAREIHDRLTRAYPHSSLMDDLKPMLAATVAEQDANKTARKAAAIARKMS